MKKSRLFFRSACASPVLAVCVLSFAPSADAQTSYFWKTQLNHAGNFRDAANWELGTGPTDPMPSFPTSGFFFMRNSGQISLVLADGETYSSSGGIRVGVPSHDPLGTNPAIDGNAVMDISGTGTYTVSQVHVGRVTGNGHLTIGENINMQVSTEFWVARDPSGGTIPTGVVDLHGTLEIYGTGNRQIDVGWGLTDASGTLHVHPTARIFGSIHRFSVGRTGATGVMNLYGEIEMATGAENAVAGNRQFEIGAGRSTVNDVTHVAHGTVNVYEGSSIGGQIERIWVGLANATGVLNIEGGEITKTPGGNSVIIGQAADSHGTVNHNSGTFTINNSLLVGNAGGTGVYNMAGGQLTVTEAGAGDNAGLAIGRTDGTHGNGTFNLSGGTVTTTPIRIAGGGANSESIGHLAITGGDLRARRIFGGTGTSSALFNGGKITVTGASTSEDQFMQGIATATVGTGGLNVDTNGFDIHLTQDFNFTGSGAVAFSNSTTTPTTVAFRGFENIPPAVKNNYSLGIGNRVTLDIAVGTEGDITLEGGSVSGAGSLVKSGGGVLIMNQNAYTGNTTVAGGTLLLGQASLGDTSTVSVADGSQLFLSHGQTDVVGALILNGETKAPGVYNQGNTDGLIAGTGSLNVIPPPPPAGFAGFMDGYADELPDEADREAGADPDGDGITNLMEYALGLDPTVPGSLPSLVGNTVTFSKGALAVESDDVIYIIETSPTLGAEPTPWVVVTPTVNNDEEISYTLPAASPGSPRNFVRLRVELED